jgi:hypothetical protein
VPKRMCNLIKLESSTQLNEYHPPSLPWPSGAAQEKILCRVLVTCTSHLRTRVSSFLFFVWVLFSSRFRDRITRLFGQWPLEKLFLNSLYFFNYHLSKKALSLLGTLCMSVFMC